MNFLSQDLLSSEASSLNAVNHYVRRLELLPKLLRCQQEDIIVDLVTIHPSWLSSRKDKFLAGRSLDNVLSEHFWSEDDLDSYLLRPECLRLFSEQMFGDGLEELFLSSNGIHDQVIYSLIRVSDPGVSQELWIRLEEHEFTFAELASSFGEGPESSRKGLIGPCSMGSILPVELAHLLRTLQPGEIHPPRQFGQWYLLIRMEELKPSRFDSDMRSFLLQQQLDKFLTNRVNSILHGVPVEELVYDNHDD